MSKSKTITITAKSIVITIFIILSFILNIFLIARIDKSEKALLTCKNSKSTIQQALNLCKDEERSESTKQEMIDACYEDASENYHKQWLSYCKTNNIKIKDDNCEIPIDNANEFNSSYQKDKDTCIARYK